MPIKVKSKKVKGKITVQKAKFLLLTFSFTFFVLSFSFLFGCQSQPLYQDTQLLMGTYVEVISPNPGAARTVFSEIKRVEGLLSKYETQSEIFRLNQTGKLAVSPETFRLIKKAKEYSQKTNGAFDISVGPLLELWGFNDRNFRVPGDAEIKEALKRVGAQKILLQENNNVVEFSVPAMKLDLGGIAKGYALDCAAAALKQKGINSCLVNAGGQVLCLGQKFGRPWKIAIQDPRSDKIRGFLELKDKSVSTSGDYRQFFFSGKKRYSHIFDPRTGSPANSGVIAVSVIARTALEADVLSTAILVLGKNKWEEITTNFTGIEVKITEEKDA